jgi:uncharacterized membrane protein YbhN (UPF0104 family)
MRTLLASILGIIVFVVSFGFTCFLGLAIFSMTVDQPNEIELKSLLIVAILVALTLGIWLGHRVATRMV